MRKYDRHHGWHILLAFCCKTTSHFQGNNAATSFFRVSPRAARHHGHLHRTHKSCQYNIKLHRAPSALLFVCAHASNQRSLATQRRIKKSHTPFDVLCRRTFCIGDSNTFVFSARCVSPKSAFCVIFRQGRVWFFGLCRLRKKLGTRVISFITDFACLLFCDWIITRQHTRAFEPHARGGKNGFK